MSNGDPLPNADHITRACGRGLENGVITSTAFALSSRDRRAGNKLSADWVECAYANPSDQNIQGSLKRLKKAKLRVGQSIAVLNAEQIRLICRNGCHLDIIEDHHSRWQCHGAIIGMTDGPIDLDLQEDLANLANSGDIVMLS